MRKWVYILIPSILLVAGAIICAVRWRAWFMMPQEPVWTGDSIAYVFPTFGRDSVAGFERTDAGWQDTISPESLDIIVLGDIHNRLEQADYDTLAVRLPQADAVAQAGDWMERGQRYYQQLLFREWTHSALCGKPVIVCAGNHEYSKGIHKTLSPIWAETFPIAEQGRSELVTGATYYVDFPRLRFIVIDTNPMERIVTMTRTLTWLHEVMDNAGGRFIVVMMHHPVYSAAKGRVNPTVYGTFRYALGKADLVIAGHDHSYMRKYPFVLLNASGRPKPQRKTLHAEVTDSIPVYGLLSIDSEHSSLSFTAYRFDNGAIVDSLHVTHD